MKKNFLLFLFCLCTSFCAVFAKSSMVKPAGTTEFITTWDMSKTSTSGANQITFGVTVGGDVAYTWTASPSGSDGSGTIGNTSTSVTISGLPTNNIVTLVIEGTNFRAIKIDNGADKARLTNVVQWGTAQWRSMLSAFYGCNNLNITATDSPDLSRVSTMVNMFRGCSSLNGPSNIGSWGTSTITNMTAAFRDATIFNQDIGDWNTSAVTNMSSMFNGAAAFNQDISYNSLNSSWNTEKVTNMSSMFYNAAAFNQNIGNWNTSAVTNMQAMFRGAAAFNQNISFNQGAGTWNTEKVTSMSAMFRDAVAFNQEIGNWKTGAVTNLSAMFYNATLFNGDIGDWNTAKADTMASMFYGATAFNQDIGTWNTALVKDMSAMFSGAIAFNQDISTWTTSAVTNMSSMFRNADAFNQNIGGWTTTAVTNMSFMFRDGNFNQDIGGWSTASVTNMSGMFRNADEFNQDLSDWNTAAVTDMSEMFFSADNFDQSLGGWSLNQNVVMTDMLSSSGMSCSNYSATLNGWAGNINIPSGRTLGATGLQYGSNAATSRTTLTSTKSWTITDAGTSGGVCAPLPVTLVSFNARQSGKSAILKWQTTSEVGASHFEVERSENALNFEKIGRVEAVGNSTALNTYTLADELTGVMTPLVYYRLRSVDADGTFEVSRVIVLKRNETEWNLAVYPNPVGKGIYVTVEADASLGQVAIFDMLGRKMALPLTRKEPGKAEINMTGMEPGMYLVSVTTERGTVKKLLVRD